MEIESDDNNYIYQIEKRTIEGTFPKRSYWVNKAEEVESLCAKYDLNKKFFLFDELVEPLRDKVILAMADIKKARSHDYDK